MLFVVLAIGAILGLAIIWSIVQKNNLAQVAIVEPWYPLLGNGLLFLGKNDIKKFHSLTKVFDRKDKLFRLYLGPKVLFCTSDATMAQSIMTDANCMDKPYLYDYFNINQGVFVAKTHIWKGQRKALNPAFNMKILESFMSIFCEVSKKMIERLDTVGKGETINIMEHVSRCTLEMVCATTMGFNVTIFDAVDGLGHKIERYFYMAARRMMKFHLHINSIYRWTKDYQDDRTLREYLEGYGMQIYDDAVDRYSKGMLTNEETDRDINEGFRKPQIFVNQIFTNTIRKFKREEIIDNIFTMVGAGTDTSATAISFTLLQLAMYPQYQQKVYDEIVQVFPEAEPRITTEALKRLQYTEMVLNECLRLYPVVPLVLRENTADITVGGARISKGNTFAVHFYNIHRQKDTWGPDADIFDPERFSPERSAGRHPFAFLAFSGGSRNCLGTRYAIISMKIMMVYLLKNFHFKTNIRQEDIRFKFDALLRIEGGHLVQIEKRV